MRAPVWTMLLFVGVVTAWAWLMLSSMGCSPRPATVEPPRSPTPWCFRLVFRFDGRDQSALACAETPTLCANAQRRASRWGGAMGAKEVGACRVAK